MIAETVLTLVVTILSVDQGFATVDRGRMAGLRPGDAGQIYYQLTVGADTKRIDVGEGTIIEVEDSRSRLRIDGEAAVRPGYLVELEVPLTASGSGSGVEAGVEAAGTDPGLRSWIERLVPGNREVQAEIVRLVRERRLRRGAPAGPVPDRDAELRARVEKLEAAVQAGNGGGEPGRQQAEARQHQAEMAEAREEALRLARQLELAQAAQRKLEADLNGALSEVSRLQTAARDTAAAGAAPARDAEVLTRVRDWARAWSEQRVDDYLSFYARDYRPPDGLSRGAWEAQRRPRVLGPSFIEVQLEDLEILSMGAEEAAVRFRQLYRSDRFRVATIKVLELVKEGGRWRILKETIR